MRELEKQIVEWRRQMAVGGVKTSAVLDELESHLREEIEARVSDGDSEREAFQSAAARIGSAGCLRSEFNKISAAVSLPVLISAAIWFGAVIFTMVFFFGRLVAGTMGLLIFTHILTVTPGYMAALLAGGLAAYYVCCRWAGWLTPSSQQSLSRAVARFTWVSCVLSVIGWLLGMVWTHKYRGTAWDNDPREIGGVCVCVWFAALSLASGKLSDHTRILLNLIGNMIVAEAWFGGGILAHNPAMHWYGVANYLPLQLFVGVHLLFLFMGFSRKIETSET
jgi:hypothetical protein